MSGRSSSPAARRQRAVESYGNAAECIRRAESRLTEVQRFLAWAG